MRSGRTALLFVAALALFGFAPSAAVAVQPVAPADGLTFSSTEKIKLVAVPAPNDTDVAFLLYPDPTGADYFTFGPHEVTGSQVTESLDLSWLAAKFSRTGRFYWATCPVAVEDPSDPYSDYDVLTALCSPRRSFVIRFRHPQLTSRDARGYSRRVLRQHFRGAYEAGYGHRVRCSRVTRIQQRCRVEWVIGDGIYYGKIMVYRKRSGGYSGVFYRLSMRLYDEYCHLVNKRPLRECERAIRRSGQI